MTEQVFIRKASGLTRVISPWDTLAFGVVNSGLMYCMLYMIWTHQLYPGVYMPTASIIGCLLMFMPGLLYIWFSVAMPRSGGEYIWGSRIASPAWGFCAGWAITICGFAWGGALPYWATSWGFNSALRVVAIAESGGSFRTHNLWVLANTIDQPTNLLIIGTLLIASFGLVIWRGARAAMNLCWIGIVAAWIGMIAFYVGVATGGGLPSFIERFNALSGSSYENVLNAAREGGWSIGNYVTAVTVSGGLTYVSLNTIGPTYSANIMGEIKEIRKSAILANLGCLVMYLVFWYAFYSLAYYGMSPQFWEAAAFFGPGGAGMGTSGAWTFEGAMPTANFLLVFSNSNAAFAVISSICFGICTYASAMSLSFAPIRNFFAYAFDRILPTLFARTDRRGSPYLAVLLGLCFCEFFLVVNIYTYSWIAYSITAWFFAWAIVGIFGILFAYTARGKAIFEKSPDMVRKKIGGVPIIAIWGAATFIISAYIDWFMLQPIFTGLADPLYGYMTAIIFIIPPFIIYYISRAYHKAKGVLMELQFKEIPPD